MPDREMQRELREEVRAIVLQAFDAFHRDNAGVCKGLTPEHVRVSIDNLFSG